VRSTDHKPARYAVFSSPLLLPPSQALISSPVPNSRTSSTYVPLSVTICIFKQKLFACFSLSKCTLAQPALLYSYVHNLDIYSELSYLRVITSFGVFYWFIRHGCYSQAREVDGRTTVPKASSRVIFICFIPVVCVTSREGG
jgi:hypothetical protein